ncbi:MAG TPA: amidase [Candidatus Dormibacteraeota bacterium]|jgi:aspartyl-tRNA(Asn)/glutamyl-tRNA(Gln) amidotransferase subunit A
MELEKARRRILERADLNAFISVSAEEGSGTVVAVKDLVDVAGTITTAGGVILPREPAVEDAPVIRRLRQEGCVIVGKANLHEFAYGVTSVNPHYGAVRNPHDVARVAGGSSGGSAVAVAAGMCDWAVGSDTGGSIRIPASFCGVVGFKPAYGSIDMTGVIPLSPSLDTLGPLAPDVFSAARAYTMMSGEAMPREPMRRPSLAIPAGWVANLDEQTARAWRLVSAGLPEVEFIEREPLYRFSITVLQVEASTYHRRWVAETPEKYGADVLGLLRRGLDILAVDYAEALAALRELRADATRAMDGIDALVLPATAIVAPSISASIETREPITRYTRPFNATGQPVVSLPAPVRGMPVGIQVVGRTNSGTIAAAAWLEQQWKQLGA